MKRPVIYSSVLLFVLALGVDMPAQTLVPAAGGAQLETLIKKVDEQNAKIDALSQQILKLEQQISTLRPGVMIGETTPAPAASAILAASPASGNAHVVAKGETLISIAKAHKVGVDELQKFNHIEDARKLQAGQTIMIPVPGSSVPALSPSPSP